MSQSHPFQELESILFSDKYRLQTLMSLRNIKLDIHSISYLRQGVSKVVKQSDPRPLELGVAHFLTNK